MTDPRFAPGWYTPDPANATERRWWDGSSWSHHTVEWDAAAAEWRPSNIAPRPPIVSAQNPQPDRLLLDITAVGKGGASARVRVTTAMLHIDAVAGLSAWKTALGAASLGVSYVATGIASGRGGQLELPIHVVNAAYVRDERFPWAQLVLAIAGESAPFHMAWASATVAAAAINAAIAGGTEATLHADAWANSRQPRLGKPRAREKRLDEALRVGTITADEYGWIKRRGVLEDTLRGHR